MLKDNTIRPEGTQPQTNSAAQIPLLKTANARHMINE